jgi:hypothetical protein
MHVSPSLIPSWKYKGIVSTFQPLGGIFKQVDTTLDESLIVKYDPICSLFDYWHLWSLQIIFVQPKHTDTQREVVSLEM